MILVDTSLWVHHFRYGHAQLGKALLDRQILMHPFVLGEIACGNLRARSGILNDLRQLPSAVFAENNEVLDFLEQHRLYGRGVTWIDVHLLASARLTGCHLWTFDSRLGKLAHQLKVGFSMIQ
jgi:predicted nucleic acid-binding protein